MVKALTKNSPSWLTKFNTLFLYVFEETATAKLVYLPVRRSNYTPTVLSYSLNTYSPTWITVIFASLLYIDHMLGKWSNCQGLVTKLFSGNKTIRKLFYDMMWSSNCSTHILHLETQVFHLFKMKMDTALFLGVFCSLLSSKSWLLCISCFSFLNSRWLVEIFSHIMEGVLKGFTDLHNTIIRASRKNFDRK